MLYSAQDPLSRSIAEQVHSIDVDVVPRLEERCQSLANVAEVPDSPTPGARAELWDHQEQIGSMHTDVALPQVEEVHVVGRRLPALDFEQDASVADPAKVVRTERRDFVARKE